MKTALLIAISLIAATAEAQKTRVGRIAELTFETGSTDFPVAERERLQFELGRAAAWALDNPDALIIVDGHADRRGTHAANVRLSLARAQKVRDQLVAAGVAPEQIVIAAYGEAGAKRRVVVWGTRTGAGAVTAQRVTIR